MAVEKAAAVCPEGNDRLFVLVRAIIVGSYSEGRCRLTIIFVPNEINRDIAILSVMKSAFFFRSLLCSIIPVIKNVSGVAIQTAAVLPDTVL